MISMHMIIMGRVVPGSHMEQVSRPHRDVVGGKWSLLVLKLIMWVEDGRIRDGVEITLTNQASSH